MVYQKETMLENIPKKTLVVAVHPDDETLGCGGTILKHKATGDEIFWCIITSTIKSPSYSKDQIAAREGEIQSVAKAYGFKSVYKLNFPTMSLDTIPLSTLIGSLSHVIKEIEPTTIYLPFGEDVHSDHKIAFQAVYSCTKSFRYPSIKRILMMEILSETEFAPAIPKTTFTPNCFVDITDFIDKKIAIMQHYTSEMSPQPFPRSIDNIKALATLRGATAGCLYAESFMLLKEII